MPNFMSKVKNFMNKESVRYVRILFCDNPGIMLLECIIMILVGCLPALISGVWGTIIQETATGKITYLNLLLLAILGSIQTAIPYFSEYVDSVFRFKASMTMQSQIHSKASNISYEMYEDYEVNNEIARARSVFCYGYAVGMFFVFFMILSGIVALSSSFWMTISYHPVLAVVVCLLPIGAAIKIRIKQKITEMKNHLTPKRRRLLDIVSYMTEYAKVKETRLYQSGDFLIGQWKQEMVHIYNIEENTYKKVMRLECIVGYMDGIIYILSVLLCIVLIMMNKINIGEFSSVILLVTQCRSKVELLMESLGSIQEESLYVKQGFSFLNLKEESVGGFKWKHLNHLEVQQVSYRYPGVDYDCIHNISFRLDRGDTMAIVGANGAGKSTLIKVLLGLLPASNGHIFYNGRTICGSHWKERCGVQSAVFQDFNKYGLSVKENITLQEDSSVQIDEKILKKYNKEYGINLNFVFELSEGINTLLGKEFGGIDLSGGQWQQIALARGCWKRGDLIVLDEPTSALDPISEERLHDAFLKLMKDRIGIIVTHRMGIAKQMKYIAVMNGGKLEAFGEHDELMQNPTYRALWDSQADMYVDD